jgi:polysaccharide pyruvyl transferase WcaK-like protein
LRRAFSRSVVRLVANRAAYITVREEPSAQLLATMGVHRPTVEVTADPAFALNPAAPEIVQRVAEAEGLSLAEPMIGVALRAWGGHGESPVPAYARLLEELDQRGLGRVVLLPMQVPGDVTFAEEVVAQTQNPERFPIVRRAYSPAALLGLVGQMQAMVAMRLHALIFAARVGTLPFALSYDPKVEHLMRGLNLEDCLEHWRGFEPNEVAGRVQTLLNDREERAVPLLAQRPNLERLALRNAECALEVARPTAGMRRAEALILGSQE